MKGKHFRRILALVLASLMILSLCACSSGSGAAEDKTDDTVYAVKLSSSQVTGTWLAGLVDEYAANIESASNGRIDVEVYHDNALGAPADLYNMLTSGGLEILNSGFAQIGGFAVCDIVQTPFLFSNPTTAGEIMWALYRAGYLTEITDSMHLLTFLPTDMQMIALVDEQIEGVDDFQGLKIRANNGALISAIEALGATAVSITTTEVYLSLTQGVIDGAISSPSAMNAFKYSDVCKHLLTVPICTGLSFIGVNLDTWNSLPGDLQAVLDDCSLDLYYKYMNLNHDKEIESIQTMAAAGMQNYAPSGELYQEIKDATAYLQDEYVSTVTAAGYDGEAIMALVQKVIERCEYNLK